MFFEHLTNEGFLNVNNFILVLVIEIYVTLLFSSCTPNLACLMQIKTYLIQTKNFIKK